MLLPEVAERFPMHDFRDFHARELPRRLRGGNGALAAADRAPLGALAFRLPDGQARTYVPTGNGIAIREGEAEAEVVVELDPEAWSGLVDDLESAPGLLYAGRCRVTHGDPLRFVRWEPRLRAMFQGRPIFDPDDSALRDRLGAPLDPTQSFPLAALRDAREDMAHFLRETGYLVVCGVFGREEVDGFLEDAAFLRAAARAGDQRSWWGRNESGESVLCRVIHAGIRPRLAALYDDPRIQGLVALSEYELVGRRRDDYEAVSILWKNPGMAEGLSDLPWHRDCGMGGHAVMCPILILTLNLTAGSADSGELRVLPGSWRCSFPFFEASDPRAPAGVGLRVEPGDVSLHYGDALHAAPPPRGEGPYRISTLLGFAPRGSLPHHRGEGGYNDVLLGSEDGQVEHLQHVVDRVRPHGER